jgi:NNP family nitrate/nitrite transporter-like MFS transporter
MNDIADAKASFATQATIFGRRHNWLMCLLYLGTFGSFIGYAAGFPLLIKSQFAGVNPLAYAWLGPLLGALVRPFGGWLADRLGGARVTFWNFVVMALAVVGVLWFLPKGAAASLAFPFGPAGGSFTGFFLMFLVLFVTTGIGNGSTFRTIAVIFDRQQAGPVLGWTSAIAAYGAFVAPIVIGDQIKAGTPQIAMYGFAAFYALCLVLNWWFYLRKNAYVKNP